MNKEQAKRIIISYSEQLFNRIAILPKNSEIYKDNKDFLQALDIAIECLTLFDDYQEHINKLEEHEEELLDKLEKIDSLDNDWVDVRDRLPEDRERVLVSDDTKFVTDCNYTDDLYELDNNDFAKYKGKSKWGFYYYIKDMGFLEFDSVLAWKPLPEPYERKEYQNDR